MEYVNEYTIIGAGSTVLENIESRKVVYGNPAIVIRERNPRDRYLEEIKMPHTSILLIYLVCVL